MSNAPNLDEKPPHVEIPEGLKELMSDITREVLRHQPKKLFDFISNYLSTLIMTRDHGIVSVKILADLCDCKPTLSEHLLEIGLQKSLVEELSDIIKHEIELVEPQKGKEKVREIAILNKILLRFPLDEKTCAQVCQITRNAYKEYWYRKRTLEESLKPTPDEPWEIAAQHTLELYKKTKPSMMELERATLKIQSAYRAYHTRKKLLPFLKQKAKKGPKVQAGPPVDIGESREIDLGPLISIKVNKDDDVQTKFNNALKPTPCLKFTSASMTQSEVEEKVEAERQASINKHKRSVSHGVTDDADITVARSETSSIFQWKSTPRISFFEAPPIIIEDQYKDYVSEETDIEGEEIDDNMSDIPECISDTEGGLGSVATSLVESLNLTDVEEIEEEKR